MRRVRTFFLDTEPHGITRIFGVLSVFIRVHPCPISGVRILPLTALTAVALLCLWSAPVLAHKVNIFAYVEGDSVYTESYFNDGRKAVGSKVVVYDKAGTQLLEGTTDEEGLFAFKIPKMEDLKIVLQASMGHRNEYELSRSELGGKEATPESPEAAGTAVGTSVRAEGGTVIQIDMDRIAQLIDRSLERRLAPVVAAMTRIQRAQEKPGFRDVIGGIGYLVGLAGLAMYLRGRKNP